MYIASFYNDKSTEIYANFDKINIFIYFFIKSYIGTIQFNNISL
jgi:hypothetical protein